MNSLNAKDTEKVRRYLLTDAIADYPKFKSGVETSFGKFELKVLF